MNSTADRGVHVEVVLRPSTGWLDLELGAVWRYRDLLMLFVRRDFVAKYTQTVLGPLWFVLQPLLLTLVFTVVFGRIARLSTDGVPPLLFYMCGQLAWSYFAQNLGSSGGTLVANAGLFGKVSFPRLVVPIASHVSNLLALVVQLATFAAFYAYYRFVAGASGFEASWRMVLLPLVILQVAALSLGVSLLLSAVTAKYRDLLHALPLVIQVWMYATPVIYPLSSIPAAWRWVAAVNPLTPIVEFFRLALLGAGTVEPAHVAYSIAVTVVLLFAGLVSFRRVEQTFVDIV